MITIGYIGGLIASYFVYTQMNRSFFAFNTIFPIMIICMLFGKMAFLWVLSVLRFLQFKFMYHYQNSRFWLSQIIITTGSIFSIMMLFSLTKELWMELYAAYIIILCESLFLIINYFIIWALQYAESQYGRISQLRAAIDRERQMADYYSEILQEEEERRIFLHDIRKHLHTISVLNENHKTEEIREYLASLQENHLVSDRISYCESDVLNAILHRYETKCKRNHILLDIDIRKGTVERLKPEDITAIFCNLLDNALQAERLDFVKNYIEITVFCMSSGSYHVIRIKNDCKANPWERRPGLTPKHQYGFGLKSVERTVKKYRGEMEVNYDSRKNEFQVVIVLPLEGEKGITVAANLT